MPSTFQFLFKRNDFFVKYIQSRFFKMLYQIKLTHFVPFTIDLHSCDKNWTHSECCFRGNTVVYSHPDSFWVCASQEVKQVGPISIIWPPIPTKCIFFGSDRIPISDSIEIDSSYFLILFSVDCWIAEWINEQVWPNRPEHVFRRFPHVSELESVKLDTGNEDQKRVEQTDGRSSPWTFRFPS